MLEKSLMLLLVGSKAMLCVVLQGICAGRMLCGVWFWCENGVFK